MNFDLSANKKVKLMNKQDVANMFLKVTSI